MEEGVHLGRVSLEFSQLLGRHPKRVIAAAAHAPFHIADLIFGLQSELLLQEGGFIGAVGQLGDGHQGLARHVASEHEDVYFVELGGVEELAPADFGAMHVGGEKQAGQMALQGTPMPPEYMATTPEVKWCTPAAGAPSRSEEHTS